MCTCFYVIAIAMIPNQVESVTDDAFFVVKSFKKDGWRSIRTSRVVFFRMFFSTHERMLYGNTSHSSILLGIWKSATLDPFAGFTNIRKKEKNRIFPKDGPWPLGFSRWKHAETGAFWSQLSDENPMNNVGLSRLKEETIHPQLWFSKIWNL